MPVMELPFLLSATQEVLGVSLLTQRIKERISSEFSDIWVRGEVSNLKRTAAGHCYFSLKEGDALLKAVLFRGRGSRYFSRHLEDGAEVICYGSITVYEPRGEYQLIVEFVELAGQGALYAQLEYLKQRLKEEGLFDEQRKRTIPQLPQVVALVASHAAAALEDMLKILEEYPLPLEVLVYPIASQGNEAPSSIVKAFEAVGRHGRAELVVLARGGGSVEDLWAFNYESVVRTVAGSPVPVITGIGHEIDTTLADLAADLRAPTPTAAAEVIVSNAKEVVRSFQELKRRLLDEVEAKFTELKGHLHLQRTKLHSLDPKRRLREQRLHLSNISAAMEGILRERILSLRGQLAELRHRLERHSPLLKVEQDRERLVRLQEGLVSGALMGIDRRRHQLRVLEEKLKGLNPSSPLERGYALCFKDGKVVRSASSLTPQDRVRVRFLKDEALCEVIETKKGSLSGGGEG